MHTAPLHKPDSLPPAPPKTGKNPPDQQIFAARQAQEIAAKACFPCLILRHLKVTQRSGYVNMEPCCNHGAGCAGKYKLT